MKLHLRQSPVTFNETAHTYTAQDGRQLQGVTALLARQLFPDKYADVDSGTLAAAAAYGSSVHAAIEAADTFGGGDSDPNVRDYRKLLSAMGLEREANEYLVSDCEHYASSIDVVFADASIADIKTTSSLDKEWVSWQLSVYAYLMELQNPGLKVPRLYAIWLPKPQYGQPKIMLIPRKADYEVRALLEADSQGRQYAPTPTDVSEELMREVLALRDLKEDVERRDKAVREQLRQIILAKGTTGLKTPFFTVSYTPEATTQKFDSKRFKAENADLYKSYMTAAQTAERLMVKFTSL